MRKKSVIQLGDVLDSYPSSLTEIHRITNQRFGRRRSRFDNTFKRNGVPVKSKWFRSLLLFAYLMNIFTSIIRRWTQVWAWGCSPGRQLVVWCHILREHRIQMSITSYCSDVFQDIYWARIDERICWGYAVITDRRPNPNAAQSGSLTSGLSFPSFKNRSGWNTVGSLNTSGSCNTDLNKKFRSENIV